MKEDAGIQRKRSKSAVVWPNSLKPCPLCGDKDDFISTFHNGLDLWSVSCCQCGLLLEIPGGGFFTESEAIIAWNTRPPTSI